MCDHFLSQQYFGVDFSSTNSLLMSNLCMFSKKIKTKPKTKKQKQKKNNKIKQANKP